MKTINLLLWDYLILITSDNKVILQNFYMITDIGGIPFKVMENTQTYDIKICFHSSDKNYYIQEHPEYHFFIRDDDAPISHASLRDLIGQLLSQAAISKGVFPIHSAVVSYAQHGLVLLGSGGAGKTITSVDLCYTYGFNWIANDWSAITIKNACIYMIHGYDNISFRLEGFRQLHIDLQYKQDFFTTLYNHEKVIATDSELSLNRATLPQTIKHFMYVNVSPNNSNSVLVLEKKEVKCRMEYELSWVLKGENVKLVSDNENIIFEKISIKPIKGFGSVQSLAEFITNNYSVYEISGNLDYVSKQIFDISRGDRL